MKFSRKRADQCGVSLSQIVLAENTYNLPDDDNAEELLATWLAAQPESIHRLLLWMPPGSFVCGPGLAVPAPRRVGIVVGYAVDGRRVLVADLAEYIDLDNAPHLPLTSMWCDPMRLSLLACRPPATREEVAKLLGKELPE